MEIANQALLSIKTEKQNLETERKIKRDKIEGLDEKKKGLESKMDLIVK